MIYNVRAPYYLMIIIFLEVSQFIKKGLLIKSAIALVLFAFQKHQQLAEETEKLVSDALFELYWDSNTGTITLTLSEALQEHLNIKNVQNLEFVKEVGACKINHIFKQ